MSKKDYYFGKSVVPNMGSMFYLRYPIAIDDVSHADNLLGSLVREGDIFLGKSYPLPEHSHVPRSVLNAMIALGRYSEDEIVQINNLAAPTISIDIDKSIGVNGKAPAPGVPIGLGVEINYKKLKSIDLDFGGEAEKRYLSYDLMQECYSEMARSPSNYPPAFFNKNRMLIDRIAIVRHLKLVITSTTNWDIGFEAKLEAANQIGGGVNYSKKTDKSFELELDGTKSYLFGVGGVQADKWARDR